MKANVPNKTVYPRKKQITPHKHSPNPLVYHNLTKHKASLPWWELFHFPQATGRFPWG